MSELQRRKFDSAPSAAAIFLRRLGAHGAEIFLVVQRHAAGGRAAPHVTNGVTLTIPPTRCWSVLLNASCNRVLTARSIFFFREVTVKIFRSAPNGAEINAQGRGATGGAADLSHPP